LFLGGEIMSVYMFFPIIIAVVSEIFYQICAKSTPETLNPFASLTITYLVGAAISICMFYLTTRGQNLSTEWKSLNWSTFVMGLALVGVEMGSIYIYKVGWNMNTGYIMKAIILGIALIVVGYFLYQESFSVIKAAGIMVCLFGLFLINK
jgi:multidrug transporter EmrE-like cation transporter